MNSAPLVTLVASLVVAAGCAESPERAEVRWSEQEPVVLPSPPVKPPIVGRVRIHTPESSVPRVSDGGGAWHRGYAIFDAAGRLVYKCAGHSESYDSITLRPGRYIVVALVDEGVFDRRLEKVQFQVDGDLSTTVDLTEKPVAPPPPVSFDRS